MGRDITKLHPRLQEKIAQLKAMCEERGIPLGIGECFRTVAEQDALYAQGRTKPGAIVTNGRGSNYGSQHQWGIAFDFFRNIKGQEYTSIAFFEEVADLAKSIGLGWGGDWKSFVDRPHLYLPEWGSGVSVLKAQYGTPAKFMATWDWLLPDEDEAPDVWPEVTVKEFQRALIADGIELPKYGADGYWGKETEAAARKALVKRTTPTVFHNRTKLVQRVVGVEQDGYCGKATSEAIKDYQRANKLSADGVVGIKTWMRILGIG